MSVCGPLMFAYFTLIPFADGVPVEPSDLSTQTIIAVLVSIVTAMFGGGWIGNYVINKLQLRAKDKDRAMDTLSTLGERQHEELVRMDGKLDTLSNRVSERNKEIIELNIKLLDNHREICELKIQQERTEEELKEAKEDLEKTKQEAHYAKKQTDECHEHRVNCEKRLAAIEAKMWMIPDIDEK